MSGRIVLLSGLPGSGKTTLARALCAGGRAVHLRVDTIEQAICESELGVSSAIDAGYRVAAAQTSEIAALGQDVICDAVNGDAQGRAIWPAADLVIWVRVPENLRQTRVTARGFPAFPHVWEDWPSAVMELDGTSDPARAARRVWAALDHGIE